MRRLSRLRSVSVGGLLAGLWATRGVALTAPANGECASAAVVKGPDEIVRPIVAILRSHGLETVSRACGAQDVQAWLVADPAADGYRLHVTDGAGRKSARQVTDAATAASLIESWVLTEDAALWTPRAVPAAVHASAETASRTPGTDTAPHIGIGVGVAAETSISSDEAVWWGAGASACVSIGALCLGGRATFARAETTLEINRALGIAPELTRTLGSISALIARPVSAGRLRFVPSLAVGTTWLRSRAEQAGVTSTTDDLLARGDLGAMTGVAIGRGWSVGVHLGGTLALVLSGDPRQATATYVPAVPRGFLIAGLGVWYAP